MLFIVCGVSCVGKSTIMRKLQSHYDFSILPTYMTRPLRNDEKEKYSVTPGKFAELNHEGFFRFVNNLFGNSYGTPKEAAALAASDVKPWLIDFPVHHVSKAFTGLNYRVIIIDPESDEQLHKQIKASGRTDRFANIFDELSCEYGQEIAHPVDLRITNVERKPESAAQAINNYYLNLSSVK